MIGDVVDFGVGVGEGELVWLVDIDFGYGVIVWYVCVGCYVGMIVVVWL